jgi:hypothetical protein
MQACGAGLCAASASSDELERAVSVYEEKK